MNILILITYIFLEIFYFIFKYKNYEDFVIGLVKNIGEYNIVFIKIFQWIRISNNLKINNYITEKIENSIQLYTTNVPYDSNSIDYKNLLDIYKISYSLSDIFLLEQLEPINSGTISLVFEAKLNSKPIVIKVLRKNIKEHLEKGLNLLICLEQIFNYIPFVNYYVNTQMFENSRSYILEQINFSNECNNLLLFNKKFKKNKFVKIPKVYHNYTKLNTNIILMDYIKGKYLFQLEPWELDKYFYPFFKFIISSIFYKRIFHCDLHQGNILFYKENTDTIEITFTDNYQILDDKLFKVAIIDFGMITELKVSDIDFMYYWLGGVFDNKFMEFIEYLNNPTNTSNIFEKDDGFNVRFDKCIEILTNLYENKKIFNSLDKTETMISNIHFFLNELRKHNCKISSRYNFYIISTIPLFNILVKLGPNIEKKYIIKNILDKINNNDLLD